MKSAPEMFAVIYRLPVSNIEPAAQFSGRAGWIVCRKIGVFDFDKSIPRVEKNNCAVRINAAADDEMTALSPRDMTNHRRAFFHVSRKPIPLPFGRRIGYDIGFNAFRVQNV